MYPVTEQFKQKILASAREFRAKVIIDQTELDDSNIVEIKLSEPVNPADTFQLGAAASARLELTLIFEEPPEFQFETAVIKPYVGLVLDEENVEYVPLGVFNVDDISWHKKNRVTLTCFDNMVKLEKAYFTELTYPAPLSDVAQEIAQQAGVVLATTDLPDTPVQGLYGYTLREAISFVASFAGGFARFNRDGELEITTYQQTDAEITADNYFSFETAENPFTIGRLTCVVGEDEEGNQVVLVAGLTGNEILFVNPLMTQEQLNNIYVELSQLSYMPYSLKWQGNPALQAGDIITVTDVEDNTYVTLLMGQQLLYNGGLSATAEAKGKTEFAQEFQTTGPITQQITRTGNAVRAYADRLVQMIVNGELKDGTFINGTMIYSPIIAGMEGRFTGELKVGVGNDLAGISGEGTSASSIRFWAGHADKEQAPFRVTQDGTIHAAKGEFAGKVHIGPSTNFDPGYDPTGVQAAAEAYAAAVAELEAARAQAAMEEVLSEETAARLAQTEENLAAAQAYAAEQALQAYTNAKNEAKQETLQEVDEKYDEQHQNVGNTFTFLPDGLTISRPGSPLQLVITNEDLQFKDGGSAVAWINGQKLYITETEIVDALKVGAHSVWRYDQNPDITLVGWVG